MTPSPVDASVLRRYLLAQLSEPERERLEDSYFDDDEMFAALVAAEEELMSDYLAGRLSDQDRVLFEQESLTTPGGRGRVRFARAEARLGSAPAVSATATSGPWWQWAAAAAILAFAVSTVWLFVENRRFKEELAGAETSRDEFRRLEEAARQQAANEVAKVEQLAAKLAARQDLPPGAGQLGGIVSLSLLPALRASGGPPTVVIREGVGVVVVQIGLPTIPDANALRLTLTKRPGGIVSRADFLQPRPLTDEGVLTFMVPAAALSAGVYEATLEHLPRRGAPEPLHTYDFRVDVR